VVATDIDIQHLAAMKRSNLQVRQHDITADPLEEAFFDLVHARLVLEHVAARDAALTKMVNALRPGGILVVEDVDLSSVGAVDESLAPLFDHGWAAYRCVLTSAGFDPTFGRHLGKKLRDKGLIDVSVRGFSYEWGGELRETTMWSTPFEDLRDSVVEADLLTSQQVEEFLTLIRSPDFRAFSGILFIAWGRKA
jgi:SAM-dependent methyltransferase